jgi:hypothetical protein
MKKSSSLNYFLLGSILFLGLMSLQNVDAQLCSPLNIVPNVCLLNMNKTFTGPSSQPLCASANTDPFAVRSYTAIPSVSGDECGLAAQEDGKTCIQMYAEFQCASYCPECALKPCANFCAAIPTECPTANQLGCFDPNLLTVTCAPRNTNNCVSWKVDKNKLPDPINPSTSTTSSQQQTSTTVTTTSSAAHVNFEILVAILSSIVMALYL